MDRAQATAALDKAYDPVTTGTGRGARRTPATCRCRMRSSAATSTPARWSEAALRDRARRHHRRTGAGRDPPRTDRTRRSSRRSCSTSGACRRRRRTRPHRSIARQSTPDRPRAPRAVHVPRPDGPRLRRDRRHRRGARGRAAASTPPPRSACRPIATVIRPGARADAEVDGRARSPPSAWTAELVVTFRGPGVEDHAADRSESWIEFADDGTGRSSRSWTTPRSPRRSSPVAKDVKRPPLSAAFFRAPGGRVVGVAAGKDGLRLDADRDRGGDRAALADRADGRRRRRRSRSRSRRSPRRSRPRRP